MQIATPEIQQEPASIIGEQFFTIGQISKQLQVDPATARRMFEDVAGVIELSTGSTPRKGKKRGYRVLRVPASALKAVLEERTIAKQPTVSHRKGSAA